MNAEESFELLRQLFKAQGVKTLVMPESLRNISSFDHGLRGQLYRNYDYADIARWIRENCLTPWDLLSLRDPFGISYILLRTDNITNQESYYISIGPYIDIRNQPDAADTIQRLHLDPSAEPILTEHYRHLPLQHDMLNLMAAFYRQIFPDIKYRILKKDLSAGTEAGKQAADLPDIQRNISDQRITEQYRIEGQIRSAVRKGDVNEARSAMLAFKQIHSEKDFRNDTEYNRLYLNTLNDLLRAAAADAQVHPSHIDRLASEYKQKIRSTDQKTRFSNLIDQMLTGYCDLVNMYSLKGYSQLIRDVLNHIEFHLQENLGLKELAALFSVNSSYLSDRFKRETGSSLTEYVTARRMQQAARLLESSALSIGEIAQAVGIPDENYFSRVFRKKTGMSPSAYRKSLSS